MSMQGISVCSAWKTLRIVRRYGWICRVTQRRKIGRTRGVDIDWFGFERRRSWQILI